MRSTTRLRPTRGRPRRATPPTPRRPTGAIAHARTDVAADARADTVADTAADPGADGARRTDRASRDAPAPRRGDPTPKPTPCRAPGRHKSGAGADGRPYDPLRRPLVEARGCSTSAAPRGTYTIQTDTNADDRKHCTVIGGALSIQGARGLPHPDSTLSGLERACGAVSIQNLPLTDLAWLNALEFVGGISPSRITQTT